MIRSERHRIIVEGEGPHEFSADLKTLLKLKPDSLYPADLTIAWVLRNVSATGRASIDALTARDPTWGCLCHDYSALRNNGVRAWPPPVRENQYEVMDLNTPLISTGLFTTDGHVVLHVKDEYLSKPEFETLYDTTLLEHLTEFARERAGTIRRFLQLEQATPVTYNITFESDGAIGSTRLSARSRDQIVDYLKRNKLKYLDWTEQ